MPIENDSNPTYSGKLLIVTLMAGIQSFQGSSSLVGVGLIRQITYNASPVRAQWKPRSWMIKLKETWLPA